MKKRIILFSIIFTLVLITLTGCGSKKAITTEKFIEMAKKNNFEILNATDEFKNYSQVKKATAAVSNDEWKVEFYILDTKDSAVGMFNTNKNIFDSSKSGVSSNFSVSLKNFESYTLKTNGYYKYVARIDNTIIYANVKEKYEAKAKEFIKKLGY